MLANNPSVLTGGGVATNVVNGTFQLIGPTGSIALTAQGTNQNITLTPSGTADAIIAVATGTTAGLQINNSNGGTPGVHLWLQELNGAGNSRNWGLETNFVVAGDFAITQSTTTSGSPSAAKIYVSRTGNLLIGTTTDSSNGAIQLANHTISAFGIGFGPDTSLYRVANGILHVDSLGGNNPAIKVSISGTAYGWLEYYSPDNAVYLNSGSGKSLSLRTNAGTVALTLDTSQNATFAGIVIHKSYTVATLPAAAAGNTYGTTFVSDATNAAGTGIGTAPTGGGAVKRAVYSTGAAWLLL